ncbi:hypothetical protein FH972_009120 [Carpinus fangiana]|uniref:WAT1-related protein n=1 Tax=Carpinus fangiana TaxID=176857 RepID=A0A5N6R0Y7_9ROSI|nr:hypothetical protein FH972_009120 [Carpinus fangiana]
MIGGVFVIALLSCSVQMLKAFGIGYSTPTLASVMSDLLPAYTSILAIIFGFEKLDLRVKSSQVRYAGIIVSVTGAFIVTLYKGLPITLVSLPKKVSAADQLLSSMQSNWVLGAFLLSSCSFCLAVMLLVQSRVVRDYPGEVITVALLRNIFVTILSASISLIAEKDPNAWKLSLNMELMAIGYSALFANSIGRGVHLWAIRKKGPVFVAMFKPLGIVIAVIMGVTFLGDTLYLGSAIGAATIVVGFYAAVWGQAQEKKMVEDCPTSSRESSSPRVPLLHSKSTQV